MVWAFICQWQMLKVGRETPGYPIIDYFRFCLPFLHPLLKLISVDFYSQVTLLFGFHHIQLSTSFNRTGLSASPGKQKSRRDISSAFSSFYQDLSTSVGKITTFNLLTLFYTENYVQKEFQAYGMHL